MRTKTVLGTDYMNNNFTNVLKCIKITLNSTENRKKTQKGQKDKKIVFQKDR